MNKKSCIIWFFCQGTLLIFCYYTILQKLTVGQKKITWFKLIVKIGQKSVFANIDHKQVADYKTVMTKELWDLKQEGQFFTGDDQSVC